MGYRSFTTRRRVRSKVFAPRSENRYIYDGCIRDFAVAIHKPTLTARMMSMNARFWSVPWQVGRLSVLGLALCFAQCGVPLDEGDEPAAEVQEAKAGTTTPVEKALPSSSSISVPQTTDTDPRMSLSAGIRCDRVDGPCTGAFCILRGESCAVGRTTKHCVRDCWSWAWLEECSDGTVRKGQGTCVW